MGHGLFMAFAQEEIGRVRRKHKGFFPEVEEFAVHLRKPFILLSFDVEINLARAAPNAPASPDLDGNLTPFCQCPEKVRCLVRASNCLIIQLRNYITIPQTHLGKNASSRDVTDDKSGRFIALHKRRYFQLLQQLVGICQGCFDLFSI
jgi:hypothetical protein